MHIILEYWTKVKNTVEALSSGYFSLGFTSFQQSFPPLDLYLKLFVYPKLFQNDPYI